MTLYTVSVMLERALWQDAIIAAALIVLLDVGRVTRSSTRYAVSVIALFAMVAVPLITTLALGVAPTATSRLGLTVSGAPLARLAPWLVGAWLVGVVALSVRLVAGLARTRALVAEDVLDPPDWVVALVEGARIEMHIDRVVRVVQSVRVHVPLVAGWIRPALLLPGSLVTGLAPRELELIIIHELAHIRRHDYLINVLQAVVETLLFFHPAVWWLSARIRVDREHCCDDVALELRGGNSREYAAVLLAIEESRGLALGFATAASGRGGGALVERVRRLLDGRPRRRPARASVAAAALVAASVAMLAALHESPRSNPAPVAFATTQRFAIGVTSDRGAAPLVVSPSRQHASSIAVPNAAAPSTSSRATNDSVASPTASAIGSDSASRSPAAEASATDAFASEHALLDDALTDVDASARRASTVALTQLTDPRVIQMLGNIAAQSSDSAVRRVALDGLGHRAPSLDARAELQNLVWKNSHADAQTAAMVELLRFDPDANLRAFCNQIIMTHPSADVRWAAANLLGGP